MTRLERRGNAIAFSFTALFFLMFLIFSLFVKVEPKKTFKTMTINLVSPEISPKKETSSFKEQNSRKEEIKKPVVPSSVSTEKKVPASSEKQKIFEEPKIKKSVEQLMSENNASTKKTAEWNENFFDDSQTVRSENISEAQIKSQPKSSLEGTAAKSVQAVSGISSSSEPVETQSAGASEETKKSLENIKNTFSSSVSENIKSRTSIASQSAEGKVSIKMSDGKTRELLYPRNPVIFISEENSRLVDETKKVIVRFKIFADGTVPLTGISIVPSSLLPPQIQAEIKEQIQLWRFSEEPSGMDGTASFDYTLEIR